ncbi:serine O-acetyltransferase [Stenotrophomonas maltophilia]
MTEVPATETLLSLLNADLRAARAGAPPSLLSGLARYFLDPGFATVVRYRLSVFARRFGKVGRVLSKFIWLYNVRVSACYLSPLSRIGPGLSLPHAAAVVVGDGVVAGRDLQLYQSVTLGQRGARYPCIGDGVTIFAGACVLGPLQVGDDAVVGANAVVLRSVPPRCTVAGVPARELAGK